MQHFTMIHMIVQHTLANKAGVRCKCNLCLIVERHKLRVSENETKVDDVTEQ
jgi:hypothetical protein